MAGEIATAYVGLVPSLQGGPGAITREMNPAMATAGKSSGGMFAKAFGGALALGAGAAIGGFLSGAVGAASDLNETVSKSRIIFGAQATAIETWAKGAATNLGLSQQAALEAAAGFGDMFTQLGFAGDAAADMSQSTVQMAADLGSFNNLPTEDVAQRISAAFRGEYDSLQTLIPNINAARVESQALATTGKKTAKELTAQEKAAAVLAIVHEDGAKATGDFARTSDQLANKQKILSAKFEDVKAKIGTALVPAMTALITVGMGVIDFLTENAEILKVVGVGVLIVATAITATFIPAWIALGVQSLKAGARVAAAWLLALGPVAIVIAAVLALVALVIANWGTIKKVIAAAWEWIKDVTAKVWDAIVWYFTHLTLIGIIISHWDTIKAVISAALEWVSDKISTVLTAIRVGWATAWNAVKSFFSGIWEGIKSIAGAAIDWIMDKINWVLDRWEDLKGQFAGGIEHIPLPPGYDPSKPLNQQRWTPDGGATQAEGRGAGPQMLVNNYWPPTEPLSTGIDSAHRLAGLVGII